MLGTTEDLVSETPDAGTHITPRHVWVVGGIALLWNAFGAMDYVMTQTKNEAYMSSFTPEQLEFFSGFPARAAEIGENATHPTVIRRRRELESHDESRVVVFNHSHQHADVVTT